MVWFPNPNIRSRVGESSADLVALALGLFLVVGASGCATTSPSPARTLASEAASLGVSCTLQSGILDEAGVGETAIDLAGWLREQVAAGTITAAWADDFRQLTSAERTAALAVALGDATVQARRLVGEYNSWVRRGFVLPQMIARSNTYAELQALRLLKEDLIGLTLGEFGIRLRAAMTAAARDDRNAFQRVAGGPRPVGAALVRRVVEDFIADARAALDSRTQDPRYSTLALAELREELFRFQALATDCDPASVEAERTIRADFGLVLAASRSIRRDSRPVPNLAPRDGVGISVGEWVRNQGKRIGDEWRATAGSRDPQSEWGDVFKPSAGAKGNIIGRNFPAGALALTFDDGPDGTTTNQVLDALKQHQVPATFFLLSKAIVDHRSPLSARKIAAARRARDEGHAMASHSFTHPRFVHSRPSLRYEVDEALERFEAVLGERPRFFRLPYGEGHSDSTVRKYLASRNLVHVYWSVDTNDWATPDPEELAADTIEQLRKITRGVVLFHDTKRQTAAAIDRILAFIKQDPARYSPVTIPQIVDRMNGVEARPDPLDDFGTGRRKARPHPIDRFGSE